MMMNIQILPLLFIIICSADLLLARDSNGFSDSSIEMREAQPSWASSYGRDSKVLSDASTGSRRAQDSWTSQYGRESQPSWASRYGRENKVLLNGPPSWASRYGREAGSVSRRGQPSWSRPVGRENKLLPITGTEERKSQPSWASRYGRENKALSRGPPSWASRYGRENIMENEEKGLKRDDLERYSVKIKKLLNVVREILKRENLLTDTDSSESKTKPSKKEDELKNAEKDIVKSLWTKKAESIVH